MFLFVQKVEAKYEKIFFAKRWKKIFFVFDIISVTERERERERNE